MCQNGCFLVWFVFEIISGFAFMTMKSPFNTQAHKCLQAVHPSDYSRSGLQGTNAASGSRSFPSFTAAAALSWRTRWTSHQHQFASSLWASRPPSPLSIASSKHRLASTKQLDLTETCGRSILQSEGVALQPPGPLQRLARQCEADLCPSIIKLIQSPF